MSVTVSTCQQISGSPLNHSTAKNLWTFSKSERFGQLGYTVNCSRAFYDLPSQTEKRAAGIGKGSKVDFTKVNVPTPSPQTYNMPGDVEQNLKKKKGYPFGVSREKMESTGILGGLNIKNPAPGKYDLGSTLSETRYTMRPKLENDFMVLTKGVPGPGQYNPLPAINEKGRYPLSKYSNSCATIINPARSKRFPKDFSSNLYAPAPGNYKIENATGMSKDGKYFVSTLHSSGVRSFPKEARRTGSTGKERTPAPGSYRLPSEFGYYEAKHKYNQSTDQKK
ncbi:hypothetical protein pb186bvf_003508 [Paramecium bursaria]